MNIVSHKNPFQIRSRCYVIFLAAIFLSQLTTTGCSWLSRPISDDPLARQMVAQLKRANGPLQQFKELAHIRLGFQKEIQSVSMALAAALPNRMRVELLSVVGQPITSLVADGQTIHIRPHGNDRIYQLRQTTTAMERFIHIPLGVEHLQGILIGRPKLPEYRVAQLKEQNSDRLIILLKSRWQTMAQLEFDPTNDRIKMLEVYNSEGERQYRVNWTQWRRIGQYDLPSKLQVESNDGYIFKLNMKRFWPDAVLSAETFQLNRSNPGNN